MFGREEKNLVVERKKNLKLNLVYVGKNIHVSRFVDYDKHHQETDT